MAIRRRIPASIRAQNPGATYPGPSSRRFGSTQTWTIGGGHKIAVFDNPIMGAAATFDLFNRNYTGMSLEAATRKWTGGNHSASYARAVSRETGIGLTDKITPELLASDRGLSLIRSMARREAGQDFPLSAEQWQQAQALALGSRQRFEELRQAQVASSQQRVAATAEAPQSEATRRMMLQTTPEPWQRISPLPTTGPQAPQMVVVDPMNPGNEPTRISPVEPDAPSRPLQPAAGPKPGIVPSAPTGWPSWAREAFERQGNMPVDPINAISPVDLVPPPPPSSSLLLGPGNISPLGWNRQQPIFRGLLSAMFGSGGF